MTMWIGEVCAVAFQLKQLGIFLNNKDIILVLITGLPTSYNIFIVTLNILNSAQLTLDYVIGCSLNEESHLIVFKYIFL